MTLNKDDRSILLIYAKFINKNAEHELNIPGQLQIQIKNKIKQRFVTVTLFDPAIHEVLTMLYQNHFKSYVKHRGISDSDKKNYSITNSAYSVFNSSGLLYSPLFASQSLNVSDSSISNLFKN